MASNNVALTAIGIACIAAAGAGGFFALRENRAPAAPATTVASAEAAATEPPAAKAEPPVQETEAAVNPATKPAKPAAPKPAPPKPEKSESRVASAPTLNRTWPT